MHFKVWRLIFEVVKDKKSSSQKGQQIKGNKFLEINGYCRTYSIITENLKSLLGVFDLRYINDLFSKSKVRGVDEKNIFPILFLIRFLDFDNVLQLMRSGLSKKLACKKSLNLGGSQSEDLDAQIADISIVLMSYTIPALKKRFDDYETLGELFRGFKGMMLQKTLAQKTWSLLSGLFDSVFADLGIDWQAFIRIFILKRNHILEEIHKNFNELFSSPMQLAEN